VLVSIDGNIVNVVSRFRAGTEYPNKPCPGAITPRVGGFSSGDIAPEGAAQLASAVKMKFHEVSSSTPPDLQCVSRKGPRGHTWRL
jgi:hypothetical protein